MGNAKPITKHELLHNAARSECDTPWDEMEGDTLVRFCERCRTAVYDLSAVTFTLVEDVVPLPRDQRDVRGYRRNDGRYCLQNTTCGKYVQLANFFAWWPMLVLGMCFAVVPAVLGFLTFPPVLFFFCSFLIWNYMGCWLLRRTRSTWRMVGILTFFCIPANIICNPVVIWLCVGFFAFLRSSY